MSAEDVNQAAARTVRDTVDRHEDWRGVRHFDAHYLFVIGLPMFAYGCVASERVRWAGIGITCFVCLAQFLILTRVVDSSSGQKAYVLMNEVFIVAAALLALVPALIRA